MYIHSYLSYSTRTRNLGKCTDPLLHMTVVTEKSWNLHEPEKRMCNIEDTSQKNQATESRQNFSSRMSLPCAYDQPAALPLRVARDPTRTTTTGFTSYPAHPSHKPLNLTQNDITWSTDLSYHQNYKFIDLISVILVENFSSCYISTPRRTYKNF